MNNKTIHIACTTADTLPLDELEPFQGELKSLSSVEFAKLRRAIVETGFAFPIYIWKSPENVCFILGGHQRVRVLKQLRDAEGFIIPPVPVVFVEAENIVQAKRRILQDASQFGTVERQGLYEFMSEAALSITELDDFFKLPEINTAQFGAEFFKDQLSLVEDPIDEWEGMPEFNQEDKSSFRHVIVHFVNEEGAAEFFKLIGQNDTGETKSIWFPPQERMDTEAKRYGE